MNKSREEYSEELDNQYMRMERAGKDIISELESTNHSKSQEQILDAAYSFFLCCYHLREWVKEDSRVTQDIKNKLPTFEKNNSSLQFLMCRDLANKSKHATLEDAGRFKPNDVNIKIESSGGAVFKVSFEEMHAAQEKKETIHLKDGDSIFLGNFVVFFRANRYELKGVVHGCMLIWEKFFKENDLLLPRSTTSKNYFPYISHLP